MTDPHAPPVYAFATTVPRHLAPRAEAQTAAVQGFKENIVSPFVECPFAVCVVKSRPPHGGC